MSRTPDYHLKALNTRTGERTGKVGAAWKNDDGSVSIKLDMFVTLMYDPDLLVTLFVNDRPSPVVPGEKHVDPFARGTSFKKPRASKAKAGIESSPVSVRHTIADK